MLHVKKSANLSNSSELNVPPSPLIDLISSGYYFNSSSVISKYVPLPISSISLIFIIA